MQHRLPADQSWRLRGTRLADVPEPGFYRLKLVRGGPFVPARIYVPCPFEIEDESQLGWPVERRHCAGMQRWSLRATINDEDADPLDVWQRGNRISAIDYHKMIAVRDRAVAHEPYAPEANPRGKVNLARQPSLF
jgi:hypothetical protein